MSDPFSILQAFVAFIAVLAGGWFLINSKTFPNPVHTTLTGATCFAVVGYLIANMGFVRADNTQELIRFESAAAGFAVIVFGLFPYCLSRGLANNASPYRVIQAVAAVLLLLINYDRPISLRFTDLSMDSSLAIPIDYQNSDLLLFYLALAASAASFALIYARKLFRERRFGDTFALAATGCASLAIVGLEVYQLVYAHRLPTSEWVAVALLLACAIYWRIAHRNLPVESPSIWRPETRPLPKLDGSPLAKTPSLNPRTAEPQASEAVEPTFRQAILFPIPEQDSIFISKLLSSKGYTVMHENGDHIIPASHFEEEDTAYTILFHREADDEIPAAVRTVRGYRNPNVFIVALTRYPNAPHVRMEIEAGQYVEAIRTPIKAMELFTALDSPKIIRAIRPEDSLRDVRG